MSYVQNIKTPVLMLNGRYDMVVAPWLTERLFESLGTPVGDKSSFFMTWDIPRHPVTRCCGSWMTG